MPQDSFRTQGRYPSIIAEITDRLKNTLKIEEQYTKGNAIRRPPEERDPNNTKLGSKRLVSAAGIARGCR